MCWSELCMMEPNEDNLVGQQFPQLNTLQQFPVVYDQMTIASYLQETPGCHWLCCFAQAAPPAQRAPIYHAPAMLIAVARTESVAPSAMGSGRSLAADVSYSLLLR